MFSFLCYPLRYAQICTLCLICHLSVMMVRITTVGLARSEIPLETESPKIILVLSPENHEFALNQKAVHRFAVLNCTYTTCWDIKDFMDNITYIDAIVLDWYSSQMHYTAPRVLQKYTFDSIDPLESQCPDYFNGLLNSHIAKNSDIPYDYIEFTNEEKITPKNSAHRSGVTSPWWMRFLMKFRNKTNDSLVPRLTSIRPWKELVEDQLEKARICSDIVLKSRIVDNVPFMSFCNFLFTITS